MKKKQIANLIMVAVIVLIVTAGVLGVGMVQGWFDRADGTQAVLTDIRGIVNIEREGISYALEGDTVLRAKDKITCSPGATVKIQTADGSFVLANSAQMEITDPSADNFTARVVSGEVFANTGSPAKLTFDGQEATFRETAALLSVRKGAQTISVFSGSVGEAQAGQTVDWINGKKSIGTLAIQSLNDFAIAQIRAANEDMTLCFTNAQLDKLEADRWAQLQTQLDPVGTDPTAATSPEETKPEETKPAETKPEETKPEETKPAENKPEETKPEETKPAETKPEETKPAETKPEETKPQETKPAETQPAAPEYDGYCTLTIRCDTILNNWDALDPAKAGYVPGNGVILPTVTVGFNEGETVFEVLNRACSAYGIQIEYSWTPLYDSYYIEGINHLYEFDCGEQSGWMYKVNGWFPNYGCSSYYVSDGDTIVWCYTCNGYGADVGGPAW